MCPTSSADLADGERPAPAAALVRVVVADDHPAMRGALARLVTEHNSLELIGEAADGEQALVLIESLSPDVALVDLRMPRLDGLGLLRRLVAAGSAVRVVLISGYQDGAIAHEAISLGAAGFLSKELEETDIADAVVDVAQGRSVLSPSLQSAVLDQIRAGRPEPARLSGRERELLELAADGATNLEIARHLCLSPNTVKTYWKRLYDKLGTSDRASAIAEVLRRGLLT
jgi:two-component system, NarL family, nitrate/nitrite response regulator NarL